MVTVARAQVFLGSGDPSRVCVRAQEGGAGRRDWSQARFQDRLWDAALRGRRTDPSTERPPPVSSRNSHPGTLCPRTCPRTRIPKGTTLEVNR